jgi:hypothetical protein
VCRNRLRHPRFRLRSKKGHDASLRRRIMAFILKRAIKLMTRPPGLFGTIDIGLTHRISSMVISSFFGTGIPAQRWLRPSTQIRSHWSGTRIPSPKRERGDPRWLVISPTTLNFEPLYASASRSLRAQVRCWSPSLTLRAGIAMTLGVTVQLRFLGVMMGKRCRL